MSDDTKASLTAWFTDLVKNVGIPGTICGILLYMGHVQSQFVQSTMAAQQERSTVALEAMNTLVAGLDATFKQMAAEQRATRVVLREVQEDFLEATDQANEP